ncbi:hypothetical protein GGX14DRAFT_656681 [Mycena pura]|uniref:Uncharacterized protein n=1 Tax=Mycena pura TaxID=153505 RepID=A0AAD6Y670_9AGAR|nr:hypothetical protein GGX14DRAFT_656681 [Mycena pura]
MPARHSIAAAPRTPHVILAQAGKLARAWTYETACGCHTSTGLGRGFGSSRAIWRIDGSLDVVRCAAFGLCSSQSDLLFPQTKGALSELIPARDDLDARLARVRALASPFVQEGVGGAPILPGIPGRCDGGVSAGWRDTTSGHRTDGGRFAEMAGATQDGSLRVGSGATQDGRRRSLREHGRSGGTRSLRETWTDGGRFAKMDGRAARGRFAKHGWSGGTRSLRETWMVGRHAVASREMDGRAPRRGLAALLAPLVTAAKRWFLRSGSKGGTGTRS